MHYNELIFSDIIKDYHEKFLNVKQGINDVDRAIRNGVISPAQDDIIFKINNSIINEMNEILEVTNIIYCNWKEYIEAMDTLNSSFISKRTNLNVDILFFKEATDIINNEL